MQTSNLTPPSSGSSSSSLSSSSSSSSVCGNKKYHYNNERHQPNAKRKSGFHHSNNNYFQSNKTAPPQQITPKPFYSEFLNSKSVLYVYFKGDVLSAIDDHFNKSFTLSNSSFKPKISLSSPASPSSSSSSRTNGVLNEFSGNTTKSLSNSPPTANYSSTRLNENDLINKEDYYWSSNLSGTTAPRQVAAVVAASLTNYLAPNFSADCNQMPPTNEIWPYYQQHNASVYDNNSYQNANNLYDNWNRSSLISNNGLYNYDQQSKGNSQSNKPSNIKEEPVQLLNLNNFENNPQAYSASYSNHLETTNFTANYYNTTNRYSTPYFDSTKQEFECKNKTSNNYLQYSGFDLSNLPHLDSSSTATAMNNGLTASNTSLRDTAVAAYAAVFNY